MPPAMTFRTKMWHPNIYPDGKVCISILYPPRDDPHNESETADLRWRPVLGVETILVSVISLLSDPNDNSPANIDAAVQWRDDFEGFKKQVTMKRESMTIRILNAYSLPARAKRPRASGSGTTRWAPGVSGWSGGGAAGRGARTRRRAGRRRRSSIIRAMARRRRVRRRRSVWWRARANTAALRSAAPSTAGWAAAAVAVAMRPPQRR